MAKAKQRQLTPSWDLAGQSIRLVRSHFTPFIYIVLLPGLLYSLGGILAGSFVTPDGQLNIANLNPLGLGLIGLAALWMLLNLGPATHLELSATKEKPQLIRDYYKTGLKDTPKLAVLYLLTGLAVIVGLLAFIVPGIIAIRMFILAPYYMVDKQLPIIESMKTAARNTKPFSGAVWGVIGVQIAISFAAAFTGALPVLGIVLSQLITYTVTFLLVLRYRTIER